MCLVALCKLDQSLQPAMRYQQQNRLLPRWRSHMRYLSSLLPPAQLLPCMCRSCSSHWPNSSSSRLQWRLPAHKARQLARQQWLLLQLLLAVMQAARHGT
jgi:hypothetical protein